MLWRLIIEEFGTELKYIKDENNILANDLSCLKVCDNQEILNISDLYGYNDADLPDSSYHIFNRDIYKS